MIVNPSILIRGIQEPTKESVEEAEEEEDDLCALLPHTTRSSFVAKPTRFRLIFYSDPEKKHSFMQGTNLTERVVLNLPVQSTKFCM